MNMRLYTMLGCAVTALALAACTTETGDGSGGAGGGGGDGTGNVGGDGSGGDGKGGAGGGGAPACVTCAAAITEEGDTEEGDPKPCEGESADLYDALAACTCTGPCMSVCGDNVCQKVEPSAECLTCLQAAGEEGCGDQFVACTGDA